MDTEEFGPLTSADDPSDELGQLREELQRVKQVEEELRAQNEKMDDEFGQKRAKFMELFRQKEEELNSASDLTAQYKTKADNLHTELDRLKVEVDDFRTATAISEASKEDDIDEARRKYHEEVASLQHIMKDAIAQAHQSTASKYDQERTKWLHHQEKLENELQELKSKLSREREGFLASVAKTLQKKVGATSLGAGGQALSEQENLEEDMKKAKEDAEMLRSVVLPLEEEIHSLKAKVKEFRDKVADLEGRPRDVVTSSDEEGSALVSLVENHASGLDEKVKDLNQALETEKSSRTDLEMYVAVLNTQKNVLQEDNDKLRKQLHDLCKLLEVEKREHGDLKRTWQMANDQFLQSQRLMMMDMRRMETVLSAEQQRQITEQKKKDAEREAAVEKVQELEQERKKLEDKRAASLEQTENSIMDAKGSLTSLTSLNSNDLLKFDDDTCGHAKSPLLLHRSHSNQSLEGARSNGKQDLVDGGNHETKSLQDESGALSRDSPERFMNIPNLTEAQQKAIRDPTPESEASQSLLASVKATLRSDALLAVGKRLVSDKEWEMVQRELKTAREKLGKPCDMCSNYESQLQAVQDNEKKAQAQVRTLERHLQAERSALSETQKYTSELESSLNTSAEKAEKQITTLLSKVQDSETFVTGLKQQFLLTQSELHDQMKSLTENREMVHKELRRLQEENDSLIGKHSLHAQQLQEENISLPNNLEEMQLLLLKYREEIIAAKVSKEHTEETMRSEILFLKDRVLSEQQEKTTIEETLSQDISQLQEELAILQSCKSELDHQMAVNNELSAKLKETDAQLKNIHTKSKQLIAALQSQLEEQNNIKVELDQEVQKQHIKVTSLQVDLDNSEAVQRDFVKLSQSLQIQLEKIRAAENEVRWQHEEDIDDCSNCRQAFSVTRRKHHCRHCGRIFCVDCLPKTVNSGPNLKPSRVCDVCHTILVRDATPYFSTEPPHTPD